jgi:hypothetical protein
LPVALTPIGVFTGSTTAVIAKKRHLVYYRGKRELAFSSRYPVGNGMEIERKR